VDVQISIGNRDQLVNMLQNSEVDIAVMGRPPKEMQTRAEPFAAHPHVFVSATDHPLARRGHLTVEDLRPYDFIVREKGAGTLAAMAKFFEDTHVEPRMKMELRSNETIKQAVMAGLGLGFLSLHTIGLELDQKLISMLDVQGAPVVRAWNVVHMQAKMLSPAAESFRYFMLEEAESYLAQHFGHHLSI
jgi:DNA-binding transcriptional LysR family regulator